ncbi:MAG: hypothetical protein N3A64_03100 [Desulfobacterota bacterium]|nr:hypothetical protein [Thermodesulfobacteriota bacterium]
MRKFAWGTLVLMMLMVNYTPKIAQADVDVHIGVGLLPPPVMLVSPPHLVMIPGTFVYAVPGIGIDLFFYDGWWWCPWNGVWYRSRNYHSGWACYRGVPSFYSRIHHNWKNQYRKEHSWQDRSWNHWQRDTRPFERNWGSRGKTYRYHNNEREEHRWNYHHRR